jgi:Bacterial pre-peptidase C-terminal domain
LSVHQFYFIKGKNFYEKTKIVFQCFFQLTVDGHHLFQCRERGSGRKGSQNIQKDQTQKTPTADKSLVLQKVFSKKVSGAQADAAALDPCSTAIPITVGKIISGALSSSSCLQDDGSYIDFYSFSGTAGQPISVSLNSSVFDTYLYLLDPDKDIVEENDDSGDTSNSRIPAEEGVLTLPTTGTYFIGVNSYDPNVTGAYTVSLNSDANCAARGITYNQTVSGVLTTGSCLTKDAGSYYTDLYTFSGTAGQQITIAENSTVFDAFLLLHTPSGANSVNDDDSGGGTNALIPSGGTYVLPETGVYTIEVTSSNEIETGAYTLILTRRMKRKRVVTL